MGIGFQEKKLEPQVVKMNRDSAWYGIRCQGKKIEAIQSLTSNFHLLVSIQMSYLMTLGPSNSA